MIFGGIRRAALAVAAALAFIVGVFLYGRRVEHSANRVDDLVQYKKTKEAIDEVVVSDDRAGAIERLRNNGIIR